MNNEVEPHVHWDRVSIDKIPTKMCQCEFIDRYTGSLFVREHNPQYRSVIRGWVWRGPPSCPPVIWSKETGDINAS